MSGAAEKKCVTCGVSKPLSDFFRNRAASDGHQSSCKVCSRVYAAAWQRANPKLRAASNKRWKKKNTERRADQKKRHNERHPEKHRARQAVENAVSRGKLIKPDCCEGCGELTPKRQLHGHHEDYSKPLEVEWLCLACHREADLRIAQGAYSGTGVVA